MYVTTGELEFLIQLTNELCSEEGLTDRVKRLKTLGEKLCNQRTVVNAKVRTTVAEKRKLDKNYARKKNRGGIKNAKLL